MGTNWSQDEETSSTKRHEEINKQPTLRSSSSSTTTKTTQIVDDDIQITSNNSMKLPHNYKQILKDADSLIVLDSTSSTTKLYDKLRNGIYLKQNRQKYWIDMNGRNCFKVFAKDLSITWAEDSRYWHWSIIKESHDISVPTVELLNVCWLEIHGKFETANCSSTTIYEVVLVIMVKDPAYGWDIPVNLRLILPDGSKQEHKENLMEKQRGRWIEISIGEFKTSKDGNKGEMEFSLYEYESGHWKKGLVIKEVAIRPKL